MRSEIPLEQGKLVEWFTNSRISLPRTPRRLPDGSAELVFSSESSREEQLVHCQKSVSENCFKGARAACSVGAVKACQPNWLAKIFQRGNIDESDVLKCEDDHMINCLQKTRGECLLHSKSFCQRIFAANS